MSNIIKEFAKAAALIIIVFGAPIALGLAVESSRESNKLADNETSNTQSISVPPPMIMTSYVVSFFFLFFFEELPYEPCQSPTHSCQLKLRKDF